MAFPAGPDPTHYTTVSCSDRNGIFYVGDIVELTLDKAGADAYEIRDFEGNIVSSGAVSGTTIVPDVPGGGWACGWYRVYLTGPVNDAVFFHSYGAYNFIVIRDTAGFSQNNATDPVITTSNGGDDSNDPVVKCVLGMGPTRLSLRDAQLSDVSNPYLPGVAPGDSFTGSSLWAAKLQAEATTALAPTDPARPWPQFIEFANGGHDNIPIPEVTAGYWMVAYPKTTVLDGTQVFVRSDPGTTSGTKVRVYYPNASTLVETYDNVVGSHAGAAAITAASSYIAIFYRGGDTGRTMAATAIGNAYRLGVIATVEYLYPLGVHYFEGTYNEPTLNAEQAHAQMQFQYSVHQGNPSAKATGPISVDIANLTAWQTFIDAGGLDYCDEISTHMYNSQTAGDFNLGRASIRAWLNLLEASGYSDKILWSTESTHARCSLYGSFKPRDSDISLLMTLLLEQFGLPRERNQVWYDRSHGFWGYPSWFENQDGSLNPYAALYRTLAEETFYQLHHHAMDFRSDAANKIFLGSIYKSESYGISTAVLVSHSFLPNGTVTLTIDGTTDPITYVDGWGNEATATQSSGRITVPVSNIPTYVRLPQGVDCYVYSVAPGGDDWGATPPASVSAYGRAKIELGATNAPGIIDNVFQTEYGTGVTYSEDVPNSGQVVWNSTVDVDRVVVFATPPWSIWSTLIDFDIQTTTDGTNWTTRATVTQGDPADVTFVHPTSSVQAGCTYETYWDKQWIFDVKLPATYAATGVRVYVREVSWGGEPIPEIDAAGMGQGNGGQVLCIQEIVVPSATAPTPYTAGYRDLVSGEASVVGYWRLGEKTSEATAVSEVNSPTVDGTYVPSPGPQLVTGAINDGDGAHQFINLGIMSVPHNSSLNVADTFSIEFWSNVGGDNFTGSRNVFVKGVTTECPKVIWNVGVIELWKGSTKIAHSSVAYTDPDWHHVVITKNGAATKIWLDTVDVTILDTNATFTNNTSAIEWYWRKLDEVALYNAVLSGSAVADHYNASGTPAAVPEIDDSYETPEPEISGAANVDEQIQSSEGLWLNAPTAYTFQWQASANGTTGWANVGGATRSDYIIDSGELTKYLRCQVTPANVVGAGSAATSNVVGPVGAPIDYSAVPTVDVPAIVVAPAVTGAAAVGQTLSCSTGTWTNSPTSYAYQWQQSANGTTGWSAAGSSGSTLLLTLLHEDLYLRCRVTARNDDGSGTPSYSNTVGPVTVSVASALTPVVPETLVLTPVPPSPLI